MRDNPERGRGRIAYTIWVLILDGKRQLLLGELTCEECSNSERGEAGVGWQVKSSEIDIVYITGSW